MTLHDLHDKKWSGNFVKKIRFFFFDARGYCHLNGCHIKINNCGNFLKSNQALFWSQFSSGLILPQFLCNNRTRRNHPMNSSVRKLFKYEFDERNGKRWWYDCSTHCRAVIWRYFDYISIYLCNPRCFDIWYSSISLLLAIFDRNLYQSYVGHGLAVPRISLVHTRRRYNVFILTSSVCYA